MALAVWPSGLPYEPVESSFKRELARSVQSTDVEDGPPIMRLQSHTRIKRLAYGIVLTHAEKDTFEDFVENDLNSAIDHFEMLVPLVRDDTYVERRCYIEGAQWSDSPFGPWHVIVSFSLCVFVEPLSS